MSHINALQINLSAVGREGQLITSKQAASNQSEITDRLERIIKTMYWSSRGTISGEEGGNKDNPILVAISSTLFREPILVKARLKGRGGKGRGESIVGRVVTLKDGGAPSLCPLLLP